MAINRADAKQGLRRRLRAQREERYVEHTLLHLLDIPEIARAEVVASYFAYGTEPNTAELNQALISAGKKLFLPRINKEVIEWVLWDGNLDALEQNGNFKEPIGSPLNDVNLIDLVLVPALAIDPDGFRLGQGGGFYDRALPGMRAWKHGVVYNYERMEHDLPRDSWDIAVDSW